VQLPDKPGGRLGFLYVTDHFENQLGGFSANGEISNDRLYGYTGVLTLFL